MTYEEVGVEAGLQGNTLLRYVAYMQARWSGTEGQKCVDGYASEWAVRFKAGVEYHASDMEGEAVLKRIDKKLNG